MKGRNILLSVLVLGAVSFAVIAYLISRGVLQPQNIIPSKAAGTQYGDPQMHFGCADVGTSGTVQKLNDTNAKIIYSPEWGYKKGGGGSQICYQEDYHFVPDFLTKGLDVTKNYHASMSFTFTGNRVDVRFIEGPNRGYADISIDGVKVDSYNAHTGGGIYGRPPWQSPALSCGQHTLKVEQSDKAVDNNAKGIVVDYLQVQHCTPTGGPVCAQLAGFGADVSGCSATNVGHSCTPPTNTPHLVCQNSACAVSSTATATDSGCLSKNTGDSCSGGGGGGGGGGQTFVVCLDNSCATSTTATADDPNCSGKAVGASCTGGGTGQTFVVCQNNSCASSTTATANDPSCDGKDIGATCGVSPDDLKCQGNPDAPAKCFDCKKDISTKSDSSEINTLDFACFAHYYGQDVGK